MPFSGGKKKCDGPGKKDPSEYIQASCTLGKLVALLAAV